MDSVLFPVLSRNRADGRRTGEALERAIVAVSLATIPLGLACCVLAPEIVGVVLGPKWSGAVEPFRILALGMYLRVSYKMAGAVSMSGGAVYRYAAAQFVYAAVVVGGAIAAKGLGLPGVAGVVLIGLVAEFLLLWWLAARVLAFPLSRFLRIHVVAAPLSVVVLVVTMTSATYLRSLGLADMPTLAGTGVATALVVVAATWRLPGVFLGAQGQWWFHRAKVLLLTRHGGS